MKFGLKVAIASITVYLPNFGSFGDIATLVDCARDAESAGWDGFFIWDHINRAWLTELVDPWIALTAIACATERMRLGALVTPMAQPLRQTNLTRSRYRFFRSPQDARATRLPL